MIFRRISGVLVLILCAVTGYAQQNNSIVILAKSKDDGIWLRWAPTASSTWQLGNKFGYTIERFSITPDGEMEPDSKLIITPLPLKPFTEADFAKVPASAKETLVLKELIYSKKYNTKVTANDLSSVWARNNEIENRYGIALLMCDLSIDAARAGALSYKDATVVRGKRYVYRVSVATTAPGVNPEVIMISATDPGPMAEIKDLKADFGNRKVTLSWSTLLHKGIYSAYYIEKSIDGKNFTKISDLPYVHMSDKIESETAFYVDSLTSNQSLFYYRINGISPFSEKGPFSNIASGQGKENLAGLLVIREATTVELKKTKIVWEFPTIAEANIEGFFVAGSDNPAGPYTDINKKMLLKTSREYLRETPATVNNTYYTLRAVDKTGNEITRSFPFLVQIADETPPGVPVGLSGSVDKTGLATLTWTANTEKDLLGYRVFKTNSLTEEFVEVTTAVIGRTNFQDSVNIKVLDKKIFYSVIAVDKNYNPSMYSPTLSLRRPDLIAPTAPVLIRAEILKDTFALAWVNSISEDIARYELIRIEKSEQISRTIKTWYPSAPVNSYKDNTIRPGNTYQYKIEVVDSAGNKNQTLSREFLYEPGYRKAVSNIKSLVDRENKKISLEWKNPSPGTKCIIYRKINENSFTIYQTLEGNVESFTDKGIDINNIYSYKIQPVYSKGVKSIISEEIKLTY